MAVDHYENFPVASCLLPRRFRRPVQLIYRFARQADDFADEGDWSVDERLALLKTFGAGLKAIKDGKSPLIGWFDDLGEVIHDYNLPITLFEDLLSAFAQDVTKSRYQDFTELSDYCRRSANPVGRLLLCLYGQASDQHNAWSDAICTSLQLINFWQDVAIDYQKNRIYFPQCDMNQFGITEKDLQQPPQSKAWQALMQFQTERAAALMQSGKPLAHALPGRLGMELRMIVAGGERILQKIKAVEFDVFNRRPQLKGSDWGVVVVNALFRL
ncbi:MAG: squalene synthase HpnC [Betaproteobacteria bacterium]|jgi:squalene synthase HpnC